MEKHKDIVLQQIANHLMINVGFLGNLGLFHGKIGVVLFFYNYARFSKNQIYEEFAEELLDEVFSEMQDNISFDFENGLSGIGWGILYLLKNKFVEGNPNEILEDIDRKLMEINFSRVRDLSLERGLIGVLIYFSLRLTASDDNSLFDIEFVSDLHNTISNKLENVNFDLSSIINYNTILSINNIQKTSLGLQSGYAGFGLKLIASEVDINN